MKLLSSLFLFAILCCSALAQGMDAYYPAETELVGHWEGAYIEGSSVRMIRLEIEERGEGLEGVFDVSELGWIGARGPVEQRGDTVSMAVLGADVLLFDRSVAELRGHASFRDGRSPAIHLKKVPPPGMRGFRTEEVRFPVGDVTMAGTLVLPEGPGPHPAAVFIAGRTYGPRLRHYGDAVLLARHGVAGFIFDGRGTGESGGDRALTQDLDRYADARAALDVVTARGDIRTDQVGLFTNSSGAWIGPRLAQEEGRAAFLIMTVGPAESLADQQGHVVEYMMRWNGSGFSEEEYREAFEYQKSLVEMSARGAAWDDFAEIVAQARTRPWKEFADLPDDLSNSELDYYRRRPTFDPVPYLKKTTIPVLALYGENDFVVPPHVNVPKLERYLTEAGNSDFKIVVFPGVGHGLTTTSGDRKEDGPAGHYHWSRLAPGLHDEVLDWLLPRVTTSGPVFASTASGSPSAAMAPDDSPESAAVEQAVTDYLEALYAVEPNRIERSVHRELRKIGYYRSSPDESYTTAPMTYDQLHDLAGRWNVDNRQLIDASSARRVTVLDVLDQTASARLDAEWGVDYMHLAKVDGRWQIVNVMWQTTNPE